MDEIQEYYDYLLNKLTDNGKIDKREGLIQKRLDTNEWGSYCMLHILVVHKEDKDPLNDNNITRDNLIRRWKEIKKDESNTSI